MPRLTIFSPCPACGRKSLEIHCKHLIADGRRQSPCDLLVCTDPDCQWFGKSDGSRSFIPPKETPS
jgi:hypothetical protein